MIRSRYKSRTPRGQSLTECLLLVVGVVLFALAGFSVLNAGIGTQSASMAGALSGGNPSAEESFNEGVAGSGLSLIDFDSAVSQNYSANTDEDGAYAFSQGVAAGLIDNLVADLTAVLSPVETARALAELGRLLATDLAGTVKLLYDELVVSQVDTLINGTDYERGYVLGNQVSAIKAVSVLTKATGATVLAGVAKRTDKTDTESPQLLLPPVKMIKHHIFNKFWRKSPKSQKYRDFFKKHGIDVDEFAVEIPETFHKEKIHKAGNNWTTKWKKWIDANPNATTKEVYQQAGRMMDEYGIDHVPLVRY